MNECFDEAFGGYWEVDDSYEERPKVERLDIKTFQNFQCSESWFLDNEKICDLLRNDDLDERDVNYYKASYFCYKDDKIKSSDIFKKLLETDISPAMKYSHLTSIFKLSLDEGILDFNELKDILFNKINNCVKSLGEQIGVWEMTALLYGKCRMSCEKEHLRSLILLTSINDFSSYWLLFDQLKGVSGNNFYLGCRCRALQLLLNEAEASKGFLKDIKMEKYYRLKNELIKEYGEKRIDEASKEMCKDILNTYTEKVEELPPPHACKMDGCLKTDEQINLMINNFISRYPFIFIDSNLPSP
uniref:Uncharacterized protein n=1 Tax=Strongyloides papillosus TaxID=174720 RepID=A0A0N5C744_STREA